MKIIKLDAIDSTNSFLKEMAHNTPLESFTVVVAKEQTKGRGQMGTLWVSEPKKNLLCSVFVGFYNLAIDQQVVINYAVSLALVKTLEYYNVPKVAIKWPNDILSSNKKICGVLVENVMHKRKIKSSIIGIGLNVNQIVFPDALQKVTSIKKEIKKNVDLDEILAKLMEQLQASISAMNQISATNLKQEYLKYLYKKDTPTVFKNSRDVLFMGKIIGVSSLGKLQIEIEDESIQEFGIKEVSIA
jgi:BirA family transcriptional regulator, biotin operon repressor / biotin---[acetyl-CoA-carboxylase] ligase